MAYASASENSNVSRNPMNICITASLCHSPCHTLFLSATTGMCPVRLGHPPCIMKGQ